MRQFLELPNGIPAHDTFNRVFRLIDADAFNACLTKWSKELLAQLEDYQVNIDGKVLRATGKRGKKTAARCLVSAWVADHFDQDIQTDYVAGRLERRTIYVCKDLQYLEELKAWSDCQCAILVQSERSFKNGVQKKSVQTRFYVSSKAEDADYFGICTRNHWSIENQLHWYLDVVSDEDRQRVRSDHAPENMATLRKMALQILLQKKGRDSLKKTRKRAAWSDKFLVHLLNTFNKTV